MTPTATAGKKSLRDKLAGIESDLEGLQEQRVEAVSECDQAKEAFAQVDGYDQDSDEFKAAQEARKHLGEIDDEIASTQAAQVEVLKMLGETPPGAETDPRRANGTSDDAPDGWNSDSLFESPETRQLLEQLSHTKARIGGMELGQVADREALAADIAPTTNMRRGQFYGVLPQLFRPLRVLDLLPTGTMDANTLPYTQESGSFNAAETTEGDPKPEDAVTYTDAEASARTIAAWLKIRKQALADVPALQAIIDNRLRYSVRRRLEGQVLNGNGTDPNIRGILQTSGRGSVPFDAGELAADQILRGITTVLLADAEADGVVVNPADWQSILLAKASGDGHYYSGGPFSITPQVIWGVPLIASPAIAQGRALVGDFSLGAMLFIREGVNVLLSDADGTDFTKNRVTLLGEMRAALAVFRPAAFAEVDLAA